MAEMMEQFRTMITEVVSTQVAKMKDEITENIKNHIDFRSRSTTIPSSVGRSSEFSNTNSSDTVVSNTVNKRRKKYQNIEYGNRTPAGINDYITQLNVPITLNHIMQYLQFVRDSFTRVLSYHEFSALETMVQRFKTCRGKKQKGTKGIPDDEFRSQVLAFVRCFDDVVFDPEYVFVYT